MSESVELLFFDTFSHDNSEELNLDLVQFPKPVYVSQVRIIPLGARVQADFPGGVRLGATNPSQFNIEFFVNDLSKPGASTFESLGGFEYNQNGCIHLECVSNDSRQIPTDGLVLRGWYTTITLAVYGNLTRVITEPIPAPVPPQAIPAPQQAPIPCEPPQPILQQPIPVEQTWVAPQDVGIAPVQIEYSQPPTATYTPTQPYQQQQEPYQQEYHEYYNAETPKDPRSYHTEPEWEENGKSRQRSTERDHSRRDASYSRSHSRDREYRDNDYEIRRRDRSASSEYREKDWDRYKHQDYKRNRGSSYDKDETRKRPRTPPISVTKRPHTPHGESQELSPGDVESISEEEIGGSIEPEAANKHKSDKNAEQLNIEGEQKANVIKTDSPDLQKVEEPSLLGVEHFEPILSDEEICDENEQFQDLDYDYSGYINNDDIIKLFNPFTSDVQCHSKLSITTEIKDYIILKEMEKTNEEVPKEINDKINTFFNDNKESFDKLLNILRSASVTSDAFKNASEEVKEEWIQHCDQVSALVNNNAVLEFIADITASFQEIKPQVLKFLETNSNFADGKFAWTCLIEWTKIGLNFEYALMQVQPGFKIRHIKSGIRLIESISTNMNAIKFLIKRKVDAQKKLIELYSKDYMALSIKLMILRTLDSTLWSKYSIEHFVGVYDQNSESENGYQTLISILKTNPSARIKFAISSILNKLHLYEELQVISENISSWYKNKYLINETEDRCSEISEENMDTVGLLLDQLMRNFCQGTLAFSQPKRFLPLSAQFEINRTEINKNVFITYFEMHNMLETFLLLLTHRTCNHFSVITNAIYEIVLQLFKFQEGLIFLTKNIDVVNIIIRCLLQSSNSEDDAQFSRAINIGLTMSYKLQTVFHIDTLKTLSQKYKNNYDAAEFLDQLHALYCLTFSNIGKLAVANVFSIGDNLESILFILNDIDFDSKSEKSDTELNKIRKSSSIGYVVDLISTTVAFANNIKYLEKYGKNLLKISQHSEMFEPTTSTRLIDIGYYLQPLNNANAFSYEDIKPLCEIIKRSIDNVVKLPEELITALRILSYLGIEPNQNIKSDYIELKYKYVILQLYSSDGISNLITILQKLCEYYDQPNLHTSVFVSNQGALIVNIIQPCLQLIRRMLTLVIACRNTQFKDLTSIPVLLQTYTLMYAFPPASLLYSNARKVCQDIIETLLAYTQPVSIEFNENESLNKSLWTLMLGEIIKYITTSPYRFITGLLIFSELLPLPLPIASKASLSDEEVLRAVNLRKLWSAHLHSHSTNIQELINTLMTSSYQLLLHLLRRVCIQLSDLAANTAMMICRGILETILTSLTAKMDKNPPDPCNSHIVRLLNFLASLMTHGAIKCAVMYLIRPNSTTLVKDEKYSTLVTLFCQVLKTNFDIPVHVQAQECIISIFQSLCDNEITLLQNIESNSDISDVYLANAVPPKEMLLTLINVMIDHVIDTDCSYTTILPILRTFILLTEHDYGFYHLRSCLEHKHKFFSTIFNRFCNHFSKTNPDCLSTISVMLDFIKLCLTVDFMEPDQVLMFAPRLSTLSISEMGNLLDWKEQGISEVKDTPKHQLLHLEELLKQSVTEDENLETLLETLSGLIRLLKEAIAKESTENISEPIFPQPEQLLVQFSSRPVFTISNDISDERMSAVYWLSAPGDDGETDIEQVQCDLIEICRQLLPPDVNLCREIEKTCRITRLGNEQMINDQSKTDRTSLDLNSYGADIDKVKKPFVTPMRGRGFARMVPQRGDPFRSRPPNTSRPPSLHVDDFVALETCGAQPTGPTGYNKLSREIMNARGTNRGRGRSFVSPEHFRQVGRTPLWPGAHESISSAPTHFRVNTIAPTHFQVNRGSSRGRGTSRLRDPVPLRHARAFPH